MKIMTFAKRPNLSLLLTLALCAPLPLAAQVPVDESGNPLAAYDDGDYASNGIAGANIEDLSSFSGGELADLVGPVALYPDDLLAVVLPASTYPLQIVQAARFLEAFENDSTLEPDESWDESIVALLNYPEVVRMLDADIDWTWRLGEAVVNQQSEVIAAIETFRDRAYAAGNLESDDRQTVVNNDGAIEISPVEDEVIYVPYYEPEAVLIHQPEPVYAYYPEPRPVYYYPYPVDYAFPTRHFWGVTTAYTIGWPNHYLNVYHPTYYGHPYYGRFYYGHYYRQPSISVYNTWYVNNNYRRASNRHRDGDYWQPRNRHAGARPGNRRVRNEHVPPGRNDRHVNRNTRVRTVENTARTGERSRTNLANTGRSEFTTAGNRPRTRSDRQATRDTEIRFRERSASERQQMERDRAASRGATSDRNGAAARRMTTRNSASGRSDASRSNSRRPVTTVRTSVGATTRRGESYRAPRLQPVTSRQSTERQSLPRSAAARPVTNSRPKTPRTAARTSSQRPARPEHAAPARASQQQAPRRAPAQRPPTSRQKPSSGSRSTPQQRRQSATSNKPRSRRNNRR